MALERAMGMTNGSDCAGLRIATPDGVELADLAVLQGLWTEEQYLKLAEVADCRLEFTDGCIEILPMVTRAHQAILRYLFLALNPLVEELGGELFWCGLGLRTRPGQFREPDLLALIDARDPRNQNQFWHGADWVLEVVSPGTGGAHRDLVQKRQDYAEAGIPEYWIVNPLDDTVTVLTLAGGRYVEHGLFRPGDYADSPVLPGFKVDVAAAFAVGEPASGGAD